MERTATGRVFTFLVARTFPLRATLALGGRPSQQELTILSQFPASANLMSQLSITAKLMSASEIELNRLIDFVVAWLDRWIITPLLGTGPESL
jgi:hypothetical protein